MLSHFSPLAPFFLCIKGISPSAEGDEGLHPSTPQAFGKGLTETFTFVFICLSYEKSVTEISVTLFGYIAS